MAMVSPKLRGDMARRTRAVSARKPASGLISAKPPSRSSSLPAPSRPKMHDLDNTISAPRTRDDDGAINHTEVLSDVITPPTKISRIARSGSGSERSVPPTSSVVRFRLDIDNDEEHLRSTASSAPSQGQRADDKIIRVLGEENLRPSLKKMSAVPATPAATGAQKTARKNVDKEDRTSHSSKAAGDEDRTGDQNQEEEEISGDSLSGGVGVEAHSPESSPRQGLKSTEEENIAFCRDTSGGPALDLGIPGKLMELMEDRDKAVHLCLQYRSKLKTAESSLRSEERRGSGLKRQLREATAAGEATKKLFEQMMEKARAEEGEKLRREARANQDEKNAKNLADEARKARLQLARAQKDLRDLWLERDELDALAKQATQGEEAARRRARQLEQVNARLRQKTESMAISGKKVVEEKAHAEARALAAEVAERDLRAAVEAIKRDFETTSSRVRTEQKTKQPSRTKRQGIVQPQVVFRLTALADGTERAGEATCPESDAGRTLESQRRRIKESTCLDEHARRIGKARGGGGGMLVNACATEAEVTRGKKCAVLTVAAVSNVAPIAWPTRRQLNPKFAVIPGRVNAISYPRRGTRVTIELPVEKKPPTEDKHREPEGDLEAVGRRASSVTEKAYDEAQKMEASSAEDKAYSDAQKVEEHSGYDGQAAPCPPPPLPRRPSDKLVVGPTPAPPLPSRPSNLSAGCTFSKTAPLLSDGSVCTAVCTPDAKLRLVGTGINNSENKFCLGDVEPTSVAEETGFGGSGRMSGSAEGGGRTAAGDVFESTATARSTTNDVYIGEEESHEAPPSAWVGEDKRETHSLEDESPAQSPKNEHSTSDMFASRLVEGVPVLKYGGKGKPKPKMLWVTPDLSELFYTRVGRTRNSKRTSHMPLAGLYVARGRSACPEVVDARHDRCFALLRDGTNNAVNNRHDTQHQNRTPGSELTTGTEEERRGSTAPGRLRWGLGGSRSPSCARGKSWRGGDGSNSMGHASGVDEPGSPMPRPGGREKMALETASVDECDKLVAEINHLMRRAGPKEDVVSSRGREIFHEWCRSAVEDDEAVPLVAAAMPLRKTGAEAQSALVGGRDDT
eukprot:jgi/Undpi1/491/HiC_scaffold_10.g03957.m1